MLSGVSTHQYVTESLTVHRGEQTAFRLDMVGLCLDRLSNRQAELLEEVNCFHVGPQYFMYVM
jgi:hypothetical protein